MTACLDHLEQLTFQLQDSKAWLTATEEQLNSTLGTPDPLPENLTAMQAQLSLIERDLLAKQENLTSVSSNSQKFLSALDNYKSANVMLLSLTLDSMSI